MPKSKEQVKVGELSTTAAIHFFMLSNFLLKDSDSTPYNVNDIKEGNEFYETAKVLCDELEIDWEKMNHEESNRVMLAMLEDAFNAINVDSNYKLTITINAKKKEQEQ